MLPALLSLANRPLDTDHALVAALIGLAAGFMVAELRPATLKRIFSWASARRDRSV